MVQPENFTLPEDFVREQRDYFAKIDEEDLIVEEADSGWFNDLEMPKENIKQMHGQVASSILTLAEYFVQF